MRDTRTGADRQKPIKGAVDKTGKKGMPTPGRSGKPEKKALQGPAARAAEARKELRREEKGKTPAPGAKTTNSRPAPKKVAQGPAARAAEARKELRKEGKGNAPRGQAAPRKSAPPATRSNSPAPRAVGPTVAEQTPTPMPAPQPPSDAAGPARTYTPAQMNAMNNDVRRYPGRLPVGSMPSIGAPRGPAQTGPITGARPVPLPQGVQAKRPVGRGGAVGRGPTKPSPPNVPGYNPFR